MTSTQRTRAIPTICRCACGDLVIGGGTAPGERRVWCSTCVAFVDAAIHASNSLGAMFCMPDEGVDLCGLLDRIERQLIVAAMERGRSKAHAARLLGLNRTTLVEKLRRMRGETEKQQPEEQRPEELAQ